MAALPEKAPATPKQPRKVLVLARAAGYVHSSIPLAARTVEEMGKKTRAWTTTITYDAADINEQNLKQYDAIFLASTTGEFLDDPNDAAATAARRKALLDFVRGGKGLAGIHAASDSYHRNTAPPPARGAAAPAPPAAGRGDAPSAGPGARTDGLSDSAPGDAAWPGHGDRHVARVQQADWRVLQVPLERRADHHGEDRRAQPSAQRGVQGSSRFRSSTRPTPSAVRPTRARTSAC